MRSKTRAGPTQNGSPSGLQTLVDVEPSSTRPLSKAEEIKRSNSFLSSCDLKCTTTVSVARSGYNFLRACVTESIPLESNGYMICFVISFCPKALSKVDGRQKDTWPSTSSGMELE